MGLFVDVLEILEYKPLITEDYKYFGEVTIYAKSLFQNKNMARTKSVVN